MQVNDTNSITQYSAGIRGSKSHFFECLFSEVGGNFINTEIVDLTNISRDTSRYTDRPVLYTISISDYILKHKETFTEASRELLAINSPEITQGSTRYLTLIPNDQGIGLFGSNAIVLETLPPRANFTIGFINPLNRDDTTLYDPNTADTVGGIALADQQLQYAVIRFRIQAQFL